MISTSVHLLWLKSYGSATSLGKFLTEALASLSDICESEKSKHCSLSHVQLFVTPWTVTYQDPLSMEFSRQEYLLCARAGLSDSASHHLILTMILL